VQLWRHVLQQLSQISFARHVTTFQWQPFQGLE
jgi:hypothetical protein